MGKISLDLTTDASSLLDGTEAGVTGIKNLSAEAKKAKEVLVAGFGKMSESTALLNKSVLEATKTLATEGKTVQQLINQYGSATAAQRAMEKELINLAAQGKRNTDEFRKLSKAASELKDNILDTRGEIRKMASDTSLFDKIAEGGRAMAAGFSVAAGASALFGDKNEDLQKSIQKAQGAMTLLLGVQEIAKIATEEGGIATGIATGAQQLYTFAVGETTGALKFFRLALLGTGIGALILIIYEAASAFGLFNSEMDSSTEKAKENKKAIDELAESYDGLGRKTIDTDQVIGRIKSGMDISTISTKELKAALSELQKQLEDVQSERRILGIPGSQFFKDSSDAAKAETKELNDNIKAIKDEIDAREKLGKAVKKAQVSLSTIDRKTIDDTIDSIIGAFAGLKVPIAEQVTLLRALGFNDDAIFKALSDAADKLAKDGSGIVKIPVGAKFIPPTKDEVNVDILGIKIPVSTDLTQDEADKISASTNALANQIKNDLNSAFETVINTQQRFIDSLDKRIEKQKQVVANEQALAKKGAESNLQLETDKLNKLNEAKDKALKKQKAVQVAQLAIDTATQLSALATAAAQVFAAYAPIIGGTAIAAALVGVMFAAFAAAKVTAAVAVSKSGGEGFREGGYTGDGDPSETSTAIGKRPYKYHKKEFVANEKMTLEGRDFLEAWHQGDKQGMLFTVSDLLKDTGVIMPDADLPQKLYIAKETHDRIVSEESNQELKKIREELTEVKEHLKKWESKPKEQTYTHGGDLIIKNGNRTVIKSKKK